MSRMGDNTNATTASSCPDLSSSSNPSGPSQSSSKVDKGKAAIPSLAPKDSKVTTTAGGKVRSWVWEHFEKIPCEDKNNQKATCNYCGAIISCPTKSGTSALSNHYETVDSKYVEELTPNVRAIRNSEGEMIESMTDKRDSRIRGLPSEFDWDYARNLLHCLKVFYDTTMRLSELSNLTDEHPVINIED
ncbi:hypothetical protein ACH5RR_000915 [Cinchona calisaya]|uniref:BED-type domain-containing protein n=1 Tax=Cinchona calisaya TaxID=153742 RepID=A0ABD3B249_9GENT